MNDYELYMKAFRENNVDLCLAIEERYQVDGYQPSIASSVIRRVAVDGEDIEDALLDIDNYVS